MEILSRDSPGAKVADHVAGWAPGLLFSIVAQGLVVAVGTRLTGPYATKPNVLGRAGGLQLANALDPDKRSEEFARLGMLPPVHHEIDLGTGRPTSFGGGVLPMQNKPFVPADVTKIADPKAESGFVRVVIPLLETWSASLPIHDGLLDLAGDIVDGYAIITSTAGVYHALQKKDKDALLGCALKLGGSACALAGDIAGIPPLGYFGVFLKFSSKNYGLVSPVIFKKQAH